MPIRHEEVSVERVPVEGREASEAEIREDEITMPVTEEDVRREEVDVEDATATRGRRGAAKTARTANSEGRAEEDRPGREETGRDEDFFEKAKRKLQGQ